MTMPGDVLSDYRIRRRVEKMVNEGNINVLTSRMIREAMEKELGPNFIDKKTLDKHIAFFVRKRLRVEKMEQEKQEQQQQEQENKTWTEAQSKNTFLKSFRLSPELQEVTGYQVLRRNEVVRLVWQYIRENNLQDPSNRSTVRCTGSKLYDLFKVESINFFEINRALKDHLVPTDEGYDDIDLPMKPDQKADASKKQKEARNPTPKRDNSRSGVLTCYPITEALQSFLETDQTKMSRAEAVERVWEYIRDNGLQRTTGSHRINCDEKLEKLFQHKSMSSAKLSRRLERHFIKESEKQAQAVEEEEEEEEVES